MQVRPIAFWLRTGVVVLVLAAVYVGAARLGLALALPPEKKATAVWPPSGIALAAILLCGSRVWPGIWLGAFLANLWDYFNPADPFSLAAHLGVSSGIAVGSTLQALLGAALLRRWVGDLSPLDRAQDVFRFVGIVLLMCPVAATVGVTSLCLAGFAPWAASPFIWLTWWLGDATGVLVMTPLFLAWCKPPPDGGPWRLAEAGLVLGLLLGTNMFIFAGWSSWTAESSPLAYLTVPLLVWAAFRFGQHGAVTALLAAAVVAVWGTSIGRGPFVRTSLNESLLLLQVFVDVLALTVLAIAAVLTERKRSDEALQKLNATLEQEVAERTQKSRALLSVLEDMQVEKRRLAEEVHERRRAEEILKLSEERFHLLVEGVMDYAIITLDAHGHVVTWNLGAQRIKGYRSEDIIGQDYSCFFPVEDQRLGKPRENLTRTAAEGRFEEEGWRIRQNGTRFMAHVVITALRDAQGVLRGFAKVVRDITERKRGAEELKRYAAELERSNRELDQFAYSASHDLKAPLRAVHNLARWIAEDCLLLPETARRDLQLMEQRIVRMERLLDDLLAYSRIGRVQHRVQRVDSRELVRDVIKLLALPEGFTIVIGKLPVLSTEHTPLEQVFLNLIGNALKHHDRADGRIEIAARDLGDKVEFVVRDDGPGIPAEYHEQVFQMFQTLKPRDEVEGSGMGLALVKKIVENQGGVVTLASKPGQGAAFHFTWSKARG